MSDQKLIQILHDKIIHFLNQQDWNGSIVEGFSGEAISFTLSRPISHPQVQRLADHLGVWVTQVDNDLQLATNARLFSVVRQVSHTKRNEVLSVIGLDDDAQPLTYTLASGREGGHVLLSGLPGGKTRLLWGVALSFALLNSAQTGTMAAIDFSNSLGPLLSLPHTTLRATNWGEAYRLISNLLNVSRDRKTVLIIDELLYLTLSNDTWRQFRELLTKGQENNVWVIATTRHREELPQEFLNMFPYQLALDNPNPDMVYASPFLLVDRFRGRTDRVTPFQVSQYHFEAITTRF